LNAKAEVRQGLGYGRVIARQPVPEPGPGGPAKEEKTEGSPTESAEQQKPDPKLAVQTDSIEIPKCTETPVNQMIKDGNKEVFGLTTLSGQVQVPVFQTEPAGKAVKVKKTFAALPAIELKFVTDGMYDDKNLTFTMACQGNDPTCQAGTFPVVWNVTKAGSGRILEGEQEHCADFQLAFYLTLGRISEIINELAGDGKTFPSEAAAKQAMQKQIALPASDWFPYFTRLTNQTSKIRDDFRKWHTPKLNKNTARIQSIGPLGQQRTVALTFISLPDVKTGNTWVHDPWEVVSSALITTTQAFKPSP